MSTTAEIERIPLRSRRCFIQAGAGAPASIASMTRDTKRGQATASSTRTARSARLVTGDVAAGGGTSEAPVTARDLARDAEHRQAVGPVRRDLERDQRIVELQHVAHVGAHGRVVRQREQARGIGVDAELAGRSTACPAIRRRAWSRR